VAIDANIPLQTQVQPLGNMLLQGYQAGSQFRQQRDEAPLRNRMLQAQATSAEQQNTAGAQRQFNDEQKSLIVGAAELKPLIDAGNVEGARASLLRRQAAAKQLGLNTRQTDEALQMLDTGGIQALKQPIDALYSVGLRSGVLQEPDTGIADYRQRSLDLQERRLDMSSQNAAADRAFRERQLASQQATGADKPADQRAAEWYMGLSPEKKAEVDRYRRGDRVTAGNEKIIYETADKAERSRQSAVNYEDLATRYESSDIGSGFFGSTVPEAIKELSGSEDGYTSLRKDYAAIKASQVVANLPPGAASDADVKLALGGFLSDKANPKQVASFLRGIAKLERLRGDYESFKSDYISENKSTVGINKAWKLYAKQQGLGGATTPSANQQVGQYQQGQIIEQGGKRYRVVGGDPNDPDVEEVQ
jgi:hypothetical protein